MSRRSAIVSIAFVASLILAAPSAASTLTRAGNTLTYTAAAGVQNDLSIFHDPDAPSTVISSADDPIAYPVPDGCDDVDAQQNSAPASVMQCDNVTAMTADLGDLNDIGTTSGTFDNLTWIGGAGNDEIDGAGGRQTIQGGVGDDLLDGGSGDDVLDGGDGDDALRGATGDDLLNGGDGADDVNGEEGADTAEGGAGADILSDADDPLPANVDILRGGAGADLLYTVTGTPGDVFDGGPGIDTFLIVAAGDPAPTVYVDLAQNIAGSGTEQDTVLGIEDVAGSITYGSYTFGSTENPATLIGDGGVNSFSSGSGNDTLNPRAGNDQILAGSGDDTIDLRDGFADRVVCGAGADTVQADTLDVVADDCEAVTRTDVGNANDAPEDAAPKVAITSPSSSAVLSTTAPNTITASASDDRGIKQVIFSTGERTLCVDTAAPYSCDYRPTAADVGRDTLVVVAVDTAEQTASAVRGVNVPRFKATSLTAATTPKRDARAPFTFTTKGKLNLPAGVPALAGCKGTVTVAFKAGKKTVSSRRVALRGNCTYSSKVTFRLPSRLNPKTLSVVTVFGGNDVLDAANARRHAVRPR